MNDNKLKYRQIEPQDKDIIYEWNNDEQTRLNSFQPGEISIETHNNWFTKKMKDLNAYYLIVLYEDKPLALVRYDKFQEITTIGINLSKESRGKGLSALIFKETSKLYFSSNNNPIFAWVKPQNIACLKALERAGYVFYKEETIHNEIALVYKLENNIIF